MAEKLLQVDLSGGDAGRRLASAAASLGDATPLFRSVAQVLEAETEANFEAQGRPSWVPLSAATRRERLKRNKGSSILKILQDSGILAASISSSYGPDFSQIGAGGAASAYAGIQHYGGTIERPAYSTKVRLRTDAKGTLLRQGKNGKLAVFAKDTHKRVRESWHEVTAYSVTIPARPYLPFSGPAGGETLQPSAEASILDVVERYLQRSIQ